VRCTRVSINAKKLKLVDNFVYTPVFSFASGHGFNQPAQRHPASRGFKLAP